MRPYHLYFLTAFVLFMISVQNITGQQSNKTVAVSYCDLIKNPELYDGKEVTFRGTYRYGFEWSELYCLQCRGIGKTWLEIGNTTKKTQKILKRLPRNDG